MQSTQGQTELPKGRIAAKASSSLGQWLDLLDKEISSGHIDTRLGIRDFGVGRIEASERTVSNKFSM